MQFGTKTIFFQGMMSIVGVEIENSERTEMNKYITFKWFQAA
jgi:hypothetical protein